MAWVSISASILVTSALPKNCFGLTGLVSVTLIALTLFLLSGSLLSFSVVDIFLGLRVVILWTSVVDSVVLLTILSVVLSGTPTINAK